MFMDDDSKEDNVTPSTAANMPFAREAAHGTMPVQATIGNNELEELAALFRDHYKGIFSVSYRITGSPSDAEDVLQTIFMRLTSSGTGSELSPNPKAYLYRAAINASLDLLRHRKRANAVSLDVLDIDRSAIANPDDNLKDLELRELIRHAVAKLEGRAATAFALRYFEGYDNRRIAEFLGTTQLVVAVTLHRARARLRKEIGNYLEKHHEAK